MVSAATFSRDASFSPNKNPPARRTLAKIAIGQ